MDFHSKSHSLATYLKRTFKHLLIINCTMQQIIIYIRVQQ